MSTYPYIENCIASLEDSGSPCWRIVKRHKKDGNNVFIATSENKFEVGGDESKDSLKQYLPEAIEHLENCILRLPPGMYVLKIFRNFSPNGLSKCIQEIDFDVPKDVNQQSRVGAPPVNPQQNIETLIEKGVQIALDKIELAKLREENAQLMEMVEDPAGWKKQIGTAFQIINENAPHVWPSLISGVTQRFFPPLGKVAGAQPVPYPGKAQNGKDAMHHVSTDETIIEETEEDMQDLTPEQKEIMDIYDKNSDAFGEVIFRLISHDRDLLTTLQKLAAKLDSGAFNINMIKPMLG